METTDEIIDEWEAARKANLDIPRDEFVRRFKDRMLRVGGEKFDDGTSIAEYADEIAPTYWDYVHQREEGPEGCADADMSYWGE